MKKPLKLLVIEDRLADFRLIERHLQKGGLTARCHCVAQLADLQAAIEKGGWDAVLSDYNVPKQIFKDTLDMLRARHPDLPVILVSGSIGEEMAVEFLKQGVSDFVLKDNLTRLVPALQRSQRDAVERRARQEAESTFRASEANFRAMFEMASIGMAQADPRTGQFLRVNQKMGTITGYTADELLGMTFSELTHPDDRQKGWEINERLVRGETPDYHIEKRYVRKDGKVAWVNVNVTAILNRAGQPVRTMATIEDITERKAAERRLQENEARLSIIFQHSPLGIVMSRLDDGRIMDVNAAFADLHGYTRDELVGRSSGELKMWAVPAQRDGMIRQLREQGTCKDLEIKARKRSGEICDLLVSVELIELAGEQFTLGLVRDITGRKRVEESHTRLATVVEQAAETIVITDISGSILYANPAFEKTTGYTRAEAIGQNPGILKSGKHDAEFYRRMWSVLERGEIWSGHFINRRKDGGLYEEEATISPVRDASGRIVNYVAVKRDVTREVQLEAQFRQSQKMEAIGQLAGGIAHDFNNILTVMFGNCNLLQLDFAENPEALDKIAEIQKAGERAKDLVQQILTFSRQREQERQVVRLDSIVKEAAKFLRASLPTNIQIETNLSANAPTVLADPTQIYQVTINLGTNALHAMEGRSGRLTITLEAFQPDENLLKSHSRLRAIQYARLTIDDTGHGMDRKTLERIFEPFFTTKPIGKGTGLGLAVVHGIIESHDGVIMVESQPGQGTIFHLCFPAQTKDVLMSGQMEGTIPCGQGQRILMVDDEIALTKAYQRLLKALNYEGTITTNPREAVSWVRENPARFDLVVTDLTMPQMNGLEVARQIRAIRVDLPIILATGFRATVTEQQLQETGIWELVEKPINMTTLAGVLRNSLVKK